MESTIENKRDTTLDSIKFVLIAFVVLGHTIQIDKFGWGNSLMFSFVNSFHMPAFVLISGYFYRDSESYRFWRGIVELLIVILLFQVLYFSKRWLDPFEFSFSGMVDRASHLYLPLRALWYILSLCFWRIFMRYYPSKVRDNYKVSLPLSIVFSILAGFIPIGGEFSLQRTFTFFPYFLLGYFIHKYELFAIIRRFKAWKSISVIIVYVIIIFLIPNFPDSMLTGSFHYWSGLSSWLIMMVLRIVSYFWMLPLAICVMNVIPDCHLFSEQGKNTMFYYLYHPFFIWLMNWFVINYNLPSSAFFLIIYTIISMYAMYWLSKIPLLVYLTKPITSIR